MKEKVKRLLFANELLSDTGKKNIQNNEQIHYQTQFQIRQHVIITNQPYDKKKGKKEHFSILYKEYLLQNNML